MVKSSSLKEIKRVSHQVDRDYRKVFLKTLTGFLVFILAFDVWNFFVRNQSLAQKLFGPVATIDSVSAIVIFAIAFVIVVWVAKLSKDTK